MISEWNSERIQYHPACLHVSLLFSGGGGVLLIEDVDVQCPRKKRVFLLLCTRRGRRQQQDNRSWPCTQKMKQRKRKTLCIGHCSSKWRGKIIGSNDRSYILDICSIIIIMWPGSRPCALLFNVVGFYISLNVWDPFFLLPLSLFRVCALYLCSWL